MSNVKDYDVVIVGAGIQGVGIAQAAVAQGWKVAVVERLAQPGLGTSSKSSKLIHGGLRYLETFQFKLVYECLRERRLLLKNAPSLVDLQKFYLPVYKSSQRSSLWIRLGLTVYYILGGLGYGAGYRKLSRTEMQVLDGLSQEGLNAVFQYYDGQTDDAALTKAVAESAEALGADFYYSAEVQTIKAEQDSYYIACTNSPSLTCKALINAAGPWANTVAERVSPAVPINNIDLVKGSHIVLDIDDIKRHYYLESPDDGRAFFVLPWKDKLMIGTTEKKLDAMPNEVNADNDEIEYLLRAFNFYFPKYKATKQNILRSFAGVRVLPAGDEGLAANKKKRETLYLLNEARPLYCAVYGGKLTSYRATAEKVIEKIKAYLPVVSRKVDTKELSLGRATASNGPLKSPY